MFHFTGQMFLGLVIGTLSKLFMPGSISADVVSAALVGLLGSTGGTLIGYALFNEHKEFIGWLGSAAGSVVLLGIYQLLIRISLHHRRQL